MFDCIVDRIRCKVGDGAYYKKKGVVRKVIDKCVAFV
jgi:hypothetical protein